MDKKNEEEDHEEKNAKPGRRVGRPKKSNMSHDEDY